MELSLKKRFIFLVTIPFVLFIINSCRISEESKNLILKDTLTGEELIRLSEVTDIVLLDVRTPEEYTEGFIDKSININYNDTLYFKSEIEKLDKSKPYLIYCRTDRRSGKTFIFMKDLGFKEVHILKGGILQWQKENKPLNIKDQK